MQHVTWTEVFIESTYMRLGHGPGQTGKPDGYMGSPVLPHVENLLMMLQK